MPRDVGQEVPLDSLSVGVPPMSEVTRVLSAIEQGDPHAAEQLLPLVYQELRHLAAQKLAQETPGQTLEATALVHEAYLRLVDAEKAQHWNSRGHFFAAAAEAMRRILVESTAERAAYLDAACGPDAALRALVQGLVKATKLPAVSWNSLSSSQRRPATSFPVPRSPGRSSARTSCSSRSARAAWARLHGRATVSGPPYRRAQGHQARHG